MSTRLDVAPLQKAYDGSGMVFEVTDAEIASVRRVRSRLLI
jgi:hypothetical protein